MVIYIKNKSWFVIRDYIKRCIVDSNTPATDPELGAIKELFDEIAIESKREYNQEVDANDNKRQE